jgi:nucleotide-binding universal stress UspA family protein
VASEAHLIEDRIDRVADTIVDEARSTKCDLVVMGTHGRRGFSHVLLGSDAERVVRQCPLPVLLVRHPEAART